MARPSKLTVTQCNRAVLLHTKRKVPVAKLAKQFHVSESSMYKVMDGSYVARPDDAKRKHTVPTVAPNKPTGATPSLFQRAGKMMGSLGDFDPRLLEVDDLTLAAAQLIVSRSRFAQALAAN